MVAVVVEKFVGVCEIEVSGEKNSVVQFARLVHEWMTERHVVFPERGVAKMTEEYPLLVVCIRVFRSFALYAFFAANPLPYGGQHIRERCSGCGLGNPVWRLTRFGISREYCRARAVLPAIVLLLEKERELCSTEIAGGDGGLSQDHHRHGTFVF